MVWLGFFDHLNVKCRKWHRLMVYFFRTKINVGLHTRSFIFFYGQSFMYCTTPLFRSGNRITTIIFSSVQILGNPMRRMESDLSKCVWDGLNTWDIKKTGKGHTTNVYFWCTSRCANHLDKINWSQKLVLTTLITKCELLRFWANKTMLRLSQSWPTSSLGCTSQVFRLY